MSNAHKTRLLLAGETCYGLWWTLAFTGLAFALFPQTNLPTRAAAVLLIVTTLSGISAIHRWQRGDSSGENIIQSAIGAALSTILVLWATFLF